MLTHIVFGNLKGKGKYIDRCISFLVLIDIYCKLQGRVTAQYYFTFSILHIREHERTKLIPHRLPLFLQLCKYFILLD